MKALRLAFALAVGSCGGAGIVEDGEPWVPVTRGDLVIEVETTGVLQASRSSQLGPPADSPTEENRISRIVPEGAAVKKGMPVIWFDTSLLDTELVARTAERDMLAMEIQQKSNELALGRRDGELRIRTAEAALRKAQLRADLPAQYAAAIEVKLAHVDLAAAEAELAMAEQRFRHLAHLGETELARLRARLAQAAARVERIEKTLRNMGVVAPSDGIVVYRTNWKGDKKKVGDTCDTDEWCVEVTSVSELYARGEVDELESARVAVGQRARLRLDAMPELEWTGTVFSLRPNAYRQSPRTPLKVVGASIRLDKIDSGRMRPAMQFRGRIEIERLPQRLLVPIEAVFPRDEGPIAFRRTANGWQKVQLELGKKSRTLVEVKRGLSAGDQVARRDLECEDDAC